jgi:hypothetical protein
MAGDAKRSSDCRDANASAGPNRRMRTMRRLRALFVIAGVLQRSCDALIVGRQRALFITVAIFVIKSRPWPRPCDALRKRGAKLRELV